MLPVEAIGGALGAAATLLVAALTVAHEHRRRRVEDRRTRMLNIGSEFLDVVAAAAHGNRDLRSLTAAKTKLLVFAGPEVVSALAEFERSELRLSESRARGAFVELLNEIRREAGRAPISQVDATRIASGKEE